MDAPPSTEIPAASPLIGRVAVAWAALPGSSKLAMVCVLFGWFFTNTLVSSLGSLQHGVSFAGLSAVIADPTRLFFEVETPLHRLLFGLLCIACLGAPLAAHGAKRPSAWIFHLAPLALMIVCAALLYWRTSGELLPMADPKSLGGGFFHFANDLVHRGTDLVARHIAIGAGAYLALIGSGVLAAEGLRQSRRSL